MERGTRVPVGVEEPSGQRCAATWMLSPSITCLTDGVRDAPVDHQAGGGEAGQSKAGKQRRAGVGGSSAKQE